jgi:hypothetical protein
VIQPGARVTHRAREDAGTVRRASWRPGHWLVRWDGRPDATEREDDLTPITTPPARD